MDLRAFYQKIKRIEEAITELFPVVVSRETPDGGRAGVKTEVPRHVAARLVVEGRADLASAEEAEAYRRELAEAKRTAELAEAARSAVQVAVLSDAQFRALKSGTKPEKA